MNLLFLFIKIIQYKLSFDKSGCIQEIKNILEESGPVWQKFAQILSYQEELISEELAIELQKMLFICPVHCHEYSKDKVKESFGEKYDINEINVSSLLGSGTIAQVYKIKDNVIKILHPNIVDEVHNARTNYLNIRNNFLFPANLRVFSDWFFDGLVEQLDMEKEYQSGITIKNLFSTKLNTTNNKVLNHLFVFPQMIEYSDSCLIMTYEKSQPILLDIRDTIDKRVLFKAGIALTFFQIVCVKNGFIHGDMHYGNFGIQNSNDYENMKIVIYDFGLMVDVRSVPQTMLDNISESLAYNNINHITRILLNNSDHHIKKVSSLFSYKNFQDDFIKLITYIIMNGIIMDKKILSIILSCEKCKIFHNIVKKLILLPEIKDDLKDNIALFENYNENTLKYILKELLIYNEFTSLQKII